MSFNVRVLPGHTPGQVVEHMQRALRLARLSGAEVKLVEVRGRGPGPSAAVQRNSPFRVPVLAPSFGGSQSCCMPHLRPNFPPASCWPVLQLPALAPATPNPNPQLDARRPPGRALT